MITSRDAFADLVGARIMDLLQQKRALRHSNGMVFWTYPRPDRVLVVFDPNEIILSKVDDDFAHELCTRLHGRRVVRTNTRGLYLQVGRVVMPYVELTTQPLDLASQPTPWSLPIGMTAKGPLWISLIEADSILVGGVRGMGKSGFLHGFIQALLHGGQTEVYAWDGKDNAEYLRYYGRPHFHLLPMDGLQAGLEEIGAEVNRRMAILTKSGAPNLTVYNTAHPNEQISTIALMIDEAAEVQDQTKLLRLVKVYRAAGVYPIFATNDPSKAGVVAKGNLGTRISFPVVSHNDSLTILAHTGAEKLPKVRGRGLVLQGAKLVEFQSFAVTYPQPGQEALDWLAGQGDLSQVRTSSEKVMILDLIGQDLSDAAIVRKVWEVSGGAKFYELRDRVKALRETSSSSNMSLFEEKTA